MADTRVCFLDGLRSGGIPFSQIGSHIRRQRKLAGHSLPRVVLTLLSVTRFTVFGTHVFTSVHKRHVLESL